MTTPRPQGWRIGLAFTPTQTTPPGWAVGLRFAEQSVPDADRLTPGGTLPLAALGFAGTLTAAFTERSSTDLTPGGTLPLAALGFAGTLTGAYLANRKTSALIAYRLEQLEKKVDKHNSVIERTFELEKRAALTTEQIKVANHRIDDLERGAQM